MHPVSRLLEWLPLDYQRVSFSACVVCLCVCPLFTPLLPQADQAKAVQEMHRCKHLCNKKGITAQGSRQQESEDTWNLKPQSDKVIPIATDCAVKIHSALKTFTEKFISSLYKPLLHRNFLQPIIHYCSVISQQTI